MRSHFLYSTTSFTTYFTTTSGGCSKTHSFFHSLMSSIHFLPNGKHARHHILHLICFNDPATTTGRLLFPSPPLTQIPIPSPQLTPATGKLHTPFPSTSTQALRWAVILQPHLHFFCICSACLRPTNIHLSKIFKTDPSPKFRVVQLMLTQEWMQYRMCSREDITTTPYITRNIHLSLTWVILVLSNLQYNLTGGQEIAVNTNYK